jgi:peptide deformylase
LRRVSRPARGADINIRDVIDRLLKTLYSVEHGRGISAVQIGIPVRVIIVNISRIPGQEMIMVDPEVVSISGRLVTRSEGCMSLPDYKGDLARRNKITIKGYDPAGAEFQVSARGYEANVIQHEIDHLNGILYWDRMTDGLRPEPIISHPVKRKDEHGRGPAEA